MGTEPCHLFIGDLHFGSTAAPMPEFTDADGVTHSPSRAQADLMAFWRQALADAKAAAKGCRVFLHLGGDAIDGERHHNTPQTIGQRADQVDLAVFMLLPWVNMASGGAALLGTEAHVGGNGTDDRTVAKALGLPARQRWRLDCAGKVLDWAHHAGLGRKEWTSETALVSLANNTLVRCLRRGERPPDLIVRHHVHAYVRTHAKGTDVCTVPGWQAQTAYTRKLDPGALLSVGVVLWWPRRGEIRPLVYDWPDDPLEVVTYGKAKAR